MTDVHDLLAQTHRALGEAEAPLDDARRGVLLSGIRRRRRRRHAAEAVGVGALVVVLGTGGWLGLQRDGTPQPAQSTAPTPSASSAPTAAPTPDASVERAPDAPGLLPALVLPPGLLESTTPGWVLTTQRPSYFSGDPVTASEPTAHVLDLVSPSGERYRVLDLPIDGWVPIVRWEAGQTHALVTTISEEGENQAATVDLLTGVITPLDGAVGVSDHVGRTGDGLDLWSSYDNEVIAHDGQRVVRRLPAVSQAVLDRTGSLLAGTGPVPGADPGDGDPGSPIVVDVVTGSVTVVPTPADDTCQPFGWSGTEVLLTCWEITPDGPVATGALRYDTASRDRAPRDLVLDGDVDGPLGRGWELPDGRVVVAGDPALECAESWGVVDPAAGTFTRGPAPAGRTAIWVEAVAGAAYVSSGGQCSGDGGPAELHRVDLDTGEMVELYGMPGTTGLPEGASWISATSSWVVGMPAD